MKKIHSVICLLLACVLIAGGIGSFFAVSAIGYSSVAAGSDGDAALFYRNRNRSDESVISGADPGAVFYSGRELEDTYYKMKAYYQQTGRSGFTAKFGTLEAFKANYADKFYMAVTSGRHTGVPAGIGVSGDYSIFPLYSSTDLSSWELIGKANGDAFVRENAYWAQIDSRTWAPELIRDPVSGLFLIYFGTVTNFERSDNKLTGKSGNEDNRTKQICIAYSETPDGPYTLLTGQIYYNYVCEHSGGSVKTVTSGGHTYALYRNDIRGDNAILTEMSGGKFLNLNGEEVGDLDPFLNFSYYHVTGYQGISSGIVPTYNSDVSDYKAVDGTTSRASIPVIDPHPFFDSNGTLFVYFTVESSGIWVIQMEDLVTPIWKTLTRVAVPNYSSVYNTGSGILGNNCRSLGSKGGTYYEANVNEGPYVVEKDGFFYLFYSRYGLRSSVTANTHGYDCLIAIADNPFGPFVKMNETLGSVIGDRTSSRKTEGNGHCSVVKAGDEYWCFYCTNLKDNSGEDIGGRVIAWDRLEFVNYDNKTFNSIKSAEISANASGIRTALTNSFTNHNGQSYASKGDPTATMYIPFGNGPTYTVQPIASATSTYRNLMRDENCTVTVSTGVSGSAKYLNDGIFSANSRSSSNYWEAQASGSGNLVVNISFATPKQIKALAIYNAYNTASGVSRISSIQFSKNGSALDTVSNLAFPDTADNSVSATAILNSELEVDAITVTVLNSDKIKSNENSLKISEIVVLGTETSEGFTVDKEGYRLVTSASQLNGASKSANYRLANNIAVSSAYSVGCDIFNSTAKFTGEFDGNGFTVDLGNGSTKKTGFLNVGGSAYVHDVTVWGTVNVAGALFGSTDDNANCDIRIERVVSEVTVNGTANSAEGVGVFFRSIGKSGYTKQVLLTDCVNFSAISAGASSPAAGGFIGTVSDASATVRLTNCVNVGKVSSEGANVGAMVGSVTGGAVTVVNGFVGNETIPLVGSGNATLTYGFDEQKSIACNDAFRVISDGQGFAYQLNNAKTAIRFVAGFGGSLNGYRFVGFLVTAKAGGNTVGGCNKLLNTVYQSVNAGVGTVQNANELFGGGCDYLFALAVTDVPLATYGSIEFCVTPYAIDRNGNFVFGKTGTLVMN